MFHNPKFFKDAEVFVPERWLGDPKYADDKRVAVQPFSVGPRNCIGKKCVPKPWTLYYSANLLQSGLRRDAPDPC